MDAYDPESGSVMRVLIELSKPLSQLGRESLLIRQSGASWEGDAGDATWIRHESAAWEKSGGFCWYCGHGYIYGRTLTQSSKSQEMFLSPRNFRTPDIRTERIRSM